MKFALFEPLNPSESIICCESTNAFVGFKAKDAVKESDPDITRLGLPCCEAEKLEVLTAVAEAEKVLELPKIADGLRCVDVANE
jgi:hypothetical protein